MPVTTRCTWTVSVIAVYNENEEPLKEAYEEFEKSIESIENPNKDIRFVIFFYDSIRKTVVIKKSEIVSNHIEFKRTDPRVVDIYEEEHKELISFFDEHVSRKELDPGEEHKHFLITWGHGAGLGFMTTEIEKRVKDLLEESKTLRNEDLAIAKHNKKEAGEGLKKVSAINTIATYLSFNKRKENEEIPKNRPEFLRLLDTSHDTGLLDEIEKAYQSISPYNLAQILREGLKDDRSIVKAINKDSQPPSHAKVQIMLCLTCYVNMIETVFEFKDIINVYVGPQTEVPFYGYNYKKLFELLNNYPWANEVQIAENITHFYLTKYLEPFIQKHPARVGTTLYDIDYKNAISFSAVYLQRFQRIAENIGLFTNEIENNLTPDIKAKLKIARSRCMSMKKAGAGDVGIIDYENFIIEFLRLYDKIRDDRRKFFHYQYRISDYCPGMLCRSNYSDTEENFLSQSPGSYSVFLPDPGFSAAETELIRLYTEMRNENGSFQKISGWHKIVDIINS